MGNSISNIACSVSGCTNPVIGQCIGYKENCGRFYCATHSKDKFCSEYSARKSRDDQIDEYIRTAKRIEKDADRESWNPMIIVLMTGGIILMLIAVAGWESSELNTRIITFVAGMILVAISGNWREFRIPRIEKNKANEMSRVKPGFAEFFRLWKKEKRKEQLLNALAIAGTIVVGVAAGAAEGAKEELKRHQISDTVDEELRRRGL
jgi:hypothetical protein